MLQVGRLQFLFSCLTYTSFQYILTRVGVTEAPPSSALKVIYFSTPALFRVLTNVALPDGAGGASHRITFTNELQQGTHEAHEYHFKPHVG